MDGGDQSRGRASLLLKVEYHEPRNLQHDYTTKISKGGMFIHTSLTLDPNRRVSFSLSFPGLLEPIELDGIVRWRRAPTADRPEEPAGLYVEFLFPSDERRQQLLDLIDSSHEQFVTHAVPLNRTFRVLLVEDNAFTLELFDYAVRRFHFERLGQGLLDIVHAADGNEALRLLDTSQIDLAIVDHFLPGITGCEVVRQIREDPHRCQIPVLVVSSGGAEIKREAFESGADLFLDKPVVHKELISTLVVLLRRHICTHQVRQ